MKVRVEAARCMGHGLCFALAPEVYRINESNGFNEMGEFDVGGQDVLAARRGAAACPERAITVEAETTTA